MALPPLPPPTWVRFTTEAPAVPSGGTLDRYRVERVSSVQGAPLSGVSVGAPFFRVTSSVVLPEGTGTLTGVTQQLGYTRAAERPDLLTTEAAGPNAVCVLIPITKSAAWWQLAHDERDAIFRGAGTHPGHVTVGLPYARTITRILYHSRPVPGSDWDFLTYFEFLPERRADFVALLEGLRDPQRNPEWNYVEREYEVWLSRV